MKRVVHSMAASSEDELVGGGMDASRGARAASRSSPPPLLTLSSRHTHLHVPVLRTRSH